MILSMGLSVCVMQAEFTVIPFNEWQNIPIAGMFCVVLGLLALVGTW
jgi:hypothetical protein